jgi:hypothetical protein
MLPSWYPLLSGDYDASDDAKPDLGKNEPHPVDLLVKGWIDEFNKAVN